MKKLVLIMAVVCLMLADYNFTPYNTTIRVEGGQIVEMNRVYTP